MPRGHPLSNSKKKAIYHAFTEGERQADIAATYGIVTGTVSKIVNEQRKMMTMASHEMVVAGDKTNGRLISTADPHRYEGTCVISGKRRSKTFTTVNARKATEMWEKWCQDLRDEQTFMDMVERKEPPDPIEETHPKDADTHEPAYLIWVKLPEPRCYGLYRTMESALAEVDKLNEIAKFLGSGGAFEVEEVAWMG